MAERQTPFNSDDAAEASSGPGGTDLVQRREPRVMARLTEAGAAGLYSWVEVEEDASGPGGWLEIAGGLAGVHGEDTRAREVNALDTLYADPADGLVVQLRPEMEKDGWVFDGAGIAAATPPVQRFARVSVAAGPAPGGSDCLKAVTSCAVCPDGAPPSWLITLSDGDGDFADANGAWTLTHVTGCTWAGVLGDWAAVLTLSAGPAVTLTLDGPGTEQLVFEDIGGASCGGPISTELTGSTGTGTAPGVSALHGSCFGAPCVAGEGVLVTPAAGPCGWTPGAAVTLEPLDASQSLVAGHVYEVWLKDATAVPPVYLADSHDVHYHQGVTITIVDVDIVYTDVDITLIEVTQIWQDVTIVIQTDIVIEGDFTWIFNTFVEITVGLQICGWLWFCAEGHVLAGGAIDLTAGVTPHAVALLTSAGAVALPAIVPVPPPVAGGGQWLFTNNTGTGTITLGGGFVVPGADQLPLKLRPGDSMQGFYDAAFGGWRVMEVTYGDFRFGASSALTVAVWNADREIDFIPEGDVGDVMTQTEDGPQWQPPAASSTPDWVIDSYKTDCVSGVNVRSVKISSMTAGVFDPGEWAFDSVQGCCDCPPAGCCPTDRFCFVVPETPPLCEKFGGKYVVFETETPCIYAGVNDEGVEAVLDLTALPDGLVTLTDGPTVVQYEMTGTASCEYGTASWATTSEGTVCPGEDWPGGFAVYAGDACQEGGPDPVPPECCDDVPAFCTVGGTAYPLTQLEDAPCVFYYLDPEVQIVVSTEPTGAVYSITLQFASVTVGCAYTRDEVDGCLGVYDRVCAESIYPATVTVS